MDIETARHIFDYFPKLMTEKEALAKRHFIVSQKIGNSNSSRIQMMMERHWLTTDVEALGLLKNGFDAFMMSVVSRMMLENPDVVFLNNCPNCGMLARTPYAKQCRHCCHQWHNTNLLLK